MLSRLFKIINFDQYLISYNKPLLQVIQFMQNIIGSLAYLTENYVCHFLFLSSHISCSITVGFPDESFSPQSNPRYSVVGVVPQAPGAPPRGAKDPPGSYYPHHHHRDRTTYLQDFPRTTSSSLLRRTPVEPPTVPGSYPAMLSPDQLPYQDVEGTLPAPVGYQGLDRKRESFSRHLSYEDDAPSTPLLKKGESCV